MVVGELTRPKASVAENIRKLLSDLESLIRILHSALETAEAQYGGTRVRFRPVDPQYQRILQSTEDAFTDAKQEGDLIIETSYSAETANAAFEKLSDFVVTGTGGTVMTQIRGLQHRIRRYHAFWRNQEKRVAHMSEPSASPKSTEEKAMSVKIFVSHASDDVELVRAFVSMIKLSMNVASGTLRCTSLPGHKLEIGTAPSMALQADINECKVLTVLLTEASLASQWVLFECGAAWGRGLAIKPVICGELSYESLPAAINPTHGVKATDHAGLIQLMSEISNATSIPLQAPAEVSDAVKTFVDKMNS